MVWTIIIVTALIALWFLVEPFFRTGVVSDSLDEEDYLAAQVDDIARDKAAGLITQEEAASANMDARRRLLSAARKAVADKAEPGGYAARQASAMIVAAAPIAAVALYVALGNPGLDETPAAASAIGSPGSSAASENARPLSEAIASLEGALEKDPGDLDNWVMLGESYAALDRFDDAAKAFGKARELAPERAFLHAAEGESLAMASGGVITAAAREAFDHALGVDPREPRARFYLAIGAYQRGDREEALNAMVALAKDAPPDAPWLSIVRSQIEMIAGELNTPVETFDLPEIQSPVAALEAEIAAGNAPYERWVALVDAYVATGDIGKAEGALSRAEARYANAPFVLQQLKAVRERLTDGAQSASPSASPVRGPNAQDMEAAAAMTEADRNAMIEGMVAGLAARLADQPDDVEGWTMLARSYGVLGDMPKSADAYSSAIELSPDDIELRIGFAQTRLALLEKQGKPIDAAAENAVGAVERLNPDHPFALYFLGLAASQQDEAAKAKQYWTRLLAAMPAGAPDASRIQSMIDAL